MASDIDNSRWDTRIGSQLSKRRFLEILLRYQHAGSSFGVRTEFRKHRFRQNRNCANSKRCCKIWIFYVIRENLFTVREVSAPLLSRTASSRLPHISAQTCTPLTRSDPKVRSVTSLVMSRKSIAWFPSRTRDYPLGLCTWSGARILLGEWISYTNPYE